MGLFDAVYVSGDVVARWGLRCASCGCVAPADADWQTKSLDPCMHEYALRHDDTGAIRLFLLERPHDMRLWRPWTEDEIRESEQISGPLRSFLVRRRGEGMFLPEAFLPRNRRQRGMGELPHRWVEIHRTCACRAFVERWIKFCDGVAAEAREEPPAHPAGFFDGTSGFED
jgi:hypothetical protein